MSSLVTDIRDIYLLSLVTVLASATVLGSVCAGNLRLGFEDTGRFLAATTRDSLIYYHGSLFTMLGSPFYAIGRVFDQK